VSTRAHGLKLHQNKGFATVLESNKGTTVAKNTVPPSTGVFSGSVDLPGPVIQVPNTNSDGMKAALIQSEETNASV
jgi:hypothetical protein